MTKQPQRHRSRELRKRRAKTVGATEAGAALAVQSVPRGKGIPVVVCGHTLSDMARALDLDQSYLSKLSRGKATPSLRVARALQDYLGAATMEDALEMLMEAGQEGEGG